MIRYLQAGDRQIDLSTPVCMGVINVTPDSFYDGSQLSRNVSGDFSVSVEKALRRAEQMHGEGAAIVDIGGESTRPGASAVDSGEEVDRVLPVVEAVLERIDVCVSVDTSSPVVMDAAIKAGVHLINDIRALTVPETLDIVAGSPVAVCLMHMQGQPRTMQKTFAYQDVVAEVKEFLARRAADLQAAGIASERLLIDPGFGFGKSLEHNYRLLRYLESLGDLGLPVLVGLSRKSMIGGVTGRPVEQRLAGSIAAATLALERGARIVRTHDVSATMDAIKVHCACNQA